LLSPYENVELPKGAPVPLNKRAKVKAVTVPLTVWPASSMKLTVKEPNPEAIRFGPEPE
jgi:hypothetical protein